MVYGLNVVRWLHTLQPIAFLLRPNSCLWLQFAGYLSGQGSALFPSTVKHHYNILHMISEYSLVKNHCMCSALSSTVHIHTAGLHCAVFRCTCAWHCCGMYCTVVHPTPSVTCLISHVMCHMSCVTCPMFFFVFFTKSRS